MIAFWKGNHAYFCKFINIQTDDQFFSNQHSSSTISVCRMENPSVEKWYITIVPEFSKCVTLEFHVES